MTTASRPGTSSSSGLNARPMVGSTPISGSRLPLISSPILSFGVAVGSVVKPAVREVKAARPSKLRFLSRMST